MYVKCLTFLYYQMHLLSKVLIKELSVIIVTSCSRSENQKLKSCRSKRDRCQWEGHPSLCRADSEPTASCFTRRHSSCRPVCARRWSWLRENISNILGNTIFLCVYVKMLKSDLFSPEVPWNWNTQSYWCLIPSLDCSLSIIQH